MKGDYKCERHLCPDLPSCDRHPESCPGKPWVSKRMPCEGIGALKGKISTAKVAGAKPGGDVRNVDLMAPAVPRVVLMQGYFVLKALFLRHDERYSGKHAVGHLTRHSRGLFARG